MKKLLFVLGILMVLTGLVSLIGALFFGKFLGFAMIYPYALEMMTVFKLNIHLAKMVAVLLTVGIWSAVFTYLLSLRSRRREIGFAMLIGLFMVYSFMLYLADFGAVGKDGRINFAEFYTSNSAVYTALFAIINITLWILYKKLNESNFILKTVIIAFGILANLGALSGIDYKDPAWVVNSIIIAVSALIPFVKSFVSGVVEGVSESNPTRGGRA